MVTAIVVAAGMVMVFVVALGLALWSEREREGRIAAREQRELAVAECKRNHPSVVTKSFRHAA